MNMKSILLGTAAGLMVASGAYAADLPGEPAPAAVDYVKVCDAFGAGFFYIPGTQTCLDISGRVRATARYQTNATDGNDRDTLADDAQLSLSADGRVDFDARTASDLGTVRSFFRLSSGAVTYSAGKDGVLGTADDSLGDRGVQVDAAYIQVGMLTVGYAGTIFNGDRLYGIDDAGNGLDDRFVAQVVASGLGGGFWVGAGIGGVGNQLSTSLNGTGGWVAPLVEAAVGIADQSWGDAALYGYYSKDVDDSYGIKAAANLKIAEGFKARLTASYFNDYNGAAKDTDTFGLSGALAYAATDAATVYAGVAYDIVDGPDAIAANVGVDYTLAEGLVGTGEVSYKDVGGKNGDSLSVIGRRKEKGITK